MADQAATAVLDKAPEIAADGLLDAARKNHAGRNAEGLAVLHATIGALVELAYQAKTLLSEASNA